MLWNKSVQWVWTIEQETLPRQWQNDPLDDRLPFQVRQIWLPHLSDDRSDWGERRTELAARSFQALERGKWNQPNGTLVLSPHRRNRDQGTGMKCTYRVIQPKWFQLPHISGIGGLILKSFRLVVVLSYPFCLVYDCHSLTKFKLIIISTQYIIYGWDSLVADIGGFMGLLLGHSAYSVFTTLTELCHNLCQRKHLGQIGRILSGGASRTVVPSYGHQRV